jgi:hypothetical protein
MLEPPECTLLGFKGKPIKPIGKIALPVSFGDLDNARTETLTVIAVDMYHPYLVIFGRGFINKFDAVIRQQFLYMKIPTPKGVITIFGDQQEAKNIETFASVDVKKSRRIRLCTLRGDKFTWISVDICKIILAARLAFRSYFPLFTVPGIMSNTTSWIFCTR